SKYKEAIYGTRAGVAFRYTYEKTAFSKDGKTMFVYLDAVKNSFNLFNLGSKPTAIRNLNTLSNLDFDYNGYDLKVPLSDSDFDKDVTVLAIDFEDKPSFDVRRMSLPIDRYTILNMQDINKLIPLLVHRTYFGDNLLQFVINEDGSQIHEDYEFKSEQSKDWIKKHAEVFHNANKGIDKNHYAGYSALSPDKQTLYLFVEGKPTGPIALKGIKNAIARIRIVGEGSMINHKIYNKLYWSDRPGIIYINVPEDRLDEHMTVVAVLLDKPIELHKEEVK